MEIDIESSGMTVAPKRAALMSFLMVATGVLTNKVLLRCFTQTS